MLDTNLKQFTKNVQQQLSFSTTASFLRFQDPQITYTDDGYVYYLATMVEQAPYLLDFTKTSNNVAVYKADRTVRGISSDFDCAGLCRKEYRFNCESFDYCATARECQLSRKHAAQSAQATRPSQICDHYSKTVNNVGPVEPTVNHAFIILKNIVYEVGLNISVYDSTTGKTGMFHAVLFDEDIIRPDSQATTSQNLNHFIPSRRNVIIVSPDVQLKGMSVDQCASRCLTEATMDCQSFDYCFETGHCALSTMHTDQNISVVHTRLMCDLYSRTYLDSYTAYPGTTTQTTGDATITNIFSADFCAQKCSRSGQLACKSFDYCATSHSCTLKTSHLLDLPKTAVKKSDICSHYSKNYVHDFDETMARNFVASGSSIQINNVTTRDACAKLCVDTGVNCQAFVLCQSTAVCTIIEVSIKQNQNKVKANPKCDLYTRQYFPDGTTYGASQSQKSNSDSSGYSGGAMAGLAVGMLIPGMVIGAALLYFMRTKRLVDEEQLRMGFVNMSHDDEDIHNKSRSSTADVDEPAHAHQYDTPN